MTTTGIPPRPSGEWDVPPQQVADELRIRQEFASRQEPQEPECAHCGDQHAELVPEPHKARYATGARVLVCKDRCTSADPERHDIDPADPFFASTAATFPAPAADADYAGTPWSAWLANRIAQMDAAWAAAHTNTTGGTA